MDFIKLSGESLPIPNRLVWCKRKRGEIYLATRLDREMSTNDDPSCDCFWHGFPYDGVHFKTNGGDLEHSTNFSDVTVESFCYVERPENK